MIQPCHLRAASESQATGSVAPLPAVHHRYVILGNHRDAWVFGAADPNSGTASLLEVSTEQVQHYRCTIQYAGNHRHAWVFGAADPNSGTASLPEVSTFKCSTEGSVLRQTL